jgi:hypothetical protein
VATITQALHLEGNALSKVLARLIRLNVYHKMMSVSKAGHTCRAMKRRLAAKIEQERSAQSP